MSLVSCTAYRAKPEKPPIGDLPLPRYGMGRLEVYDPTSMNFRIVFASEHTDYREYPQFVLPTARDWDYYYYMAPADLGAATFQFSGFIGGWDGASWPLDDMGEGYGPVQIDIDGITWNIWRTDWPGNMGGTFIVTFANG